MHPLRKTLLILSLLFRFDLPATFANPTCTPQFYKKIYYQLNQAAHISTLKPITLIPLSENVIHEIENHSIMELAQKTNGGKDLTFVLSAGEPAYVMTRKGLTGEHIQGQYLRRILEHVFPEARFKIDPDADFGGQKESKRPNEVLIYIVDGFEIPTRVPRVEMVDLKAINASIAGINKPELRRHFGLSENMLIHSYYMKEPWQSDPQYTSSRRHMQPEFRHMIPSIDAMLGILDVKPHIAFLSKGASPATADSFQMNRLQQLGYETVKLSKIRLGQLNRSKKYVVLNDMQNRVPYLHALADVAVIYGPINLFEPLFARTPTVYFFSNPAIAGYDTRGFRYVENIAVKTNGAYPVKGLHHFGNLMRRPERLQPPETLPSDIPFGDGTTPLTKVLNQIQSMIPSP